MDPLASPVAYFLTQKISTYIMKCELRNHTEISEKYIPGTMAMNRKVDCFGFRFCLLELFFRMNFRSGFIKRAIKICLYKKKSKKSYRYL